MNTRLKLQIQLKLLFTGFWMLKAHLDKHPRIADTFRGPYDFVLAGSWTSRDCYMCTGILPYFVIISF